MTADKLPMKLMPKQPKIANLKPGESGYVTPWAMSVNEEGYCYLNPNIRTHETPHGTVSLKIGKDSNGNYFAEASKAYIITFGYGYDWDIVDHIPDDHILVETVS